MARWISPSNAIAELDMAKSEQAFERAKRVLVGGVNSPVRAYGAVGGTPRFVDRAVGSRIFDIDGVGYFDLVGSWGPAILGHGHPDVVAAVAQAVQKGLGFGAPCEAETDLAELMLSAFPGHDCLRFVSTGTEAVMSAVRLARGATKRSLILKFAGNYHGHADGMLVAAGSGSATFGIPNSAGVPAEIAGLTLVAPYNDSARVEQLFKEHGDRIAAVVVEPIAGNMGFVRGTKEFLQLLRNCCTRYGALLIFDEVMTGFRVAWGGAQALLGIQPDLTCLAKVIGGGLPVGAYCGPRKLIELVSPLGPVYQAGTLSGNPVCMAAGLATLKCCNKPGFYQSLDRNGKRLMEAVRGAAKKSGIPVQVDCEGGMLGFFLSPNPIRNFEEASATNAPLYAKFFHATLKHGVWLPPSRFEAWFISSAHQEEDLQQIISAAEQAFQEIA
jgi:glutamate-1-semialdehyde 2,1-aminomutase